MTPPDPQQVAEIAGCLSKAQREALITACTTHPSVGGSHFVTCDFAGTWPVPGLATFLTLKTERLTDLGLAVRNFIQGTHHD